MVVNKVHQEQPHADQGAVGHQSMLSLMDLLDASHGGVEMWPYRVVECHLRKDSRLVLGRRLGMRLWLRGAQGTQQPGCAWKAEDPEEEELRELT